MLIDDGPVEGHRSAAKLELSLEESPHPVYHTPLGIASQTGLHPC